MRVPFRAPARRLAPPRTGGFYGLNQGSHGRELKDIDTDLSAITNFDTTGSVTLLNGVAQGTDFTQRVGRKFNMKSILLRLSIQPGSTATTNALARWIIVYDKQTNATAPAITDIIVAANESAANNLSNRDRFVIIYDKVVNIGATGSNDNQRAFFRKYKRCNMEVTNGGTGSTVGSIQTGALWFVTCGEKAAGTTAPKVLNGTARIRFHDS